MDQENEVREFYEEQVDGGVLRVPATRWRNDTSTKVTMDLFVDSVRENPRWQKHMPTTLQNPCMLPPKFMHLVVKPGEEVLVPSYLDPGVQQLVCRDFNPQCRLNPLLPCSDASHVKEVVGGLGPSLTRISPTISPGGPPKLAQHLDPSLPQASPQSIDDRLLARARRGVQ
jgi:hypothetical protein